VVVICDFSASHPSVHYKNVIAHTQTRPVISQTKVQEHVTFD